MIRDGAANTNGENENNLFVFFPICVFRVAAISSYVMRKMVAISCLVRIDLSSQQSHELIEGAEIMDAFIAGALERAAERG